MSGPISDDSTVTQVCSDLACAELFALGSGRGARFPALTPEREEAILSVLRNRLSSDRKNIQLSLLERYTRTCRKASVSHSPLPITGIKTCLYILKVATEQTDVFTRQKLAGVLEDWRNILAQAVDPSLAGSLTVWTCKALRQVCGYEDELALPPSSNKRKRSLEGDDGGPNNTPPNSLPTAQRSRPSAPTPQLMASSGHSSARLSSNSPSIQEIRPKAIGLPISPVTRDSRNPDTGRPLALDAWNSARSAPKNDCEAKTAEAESPAVTNNPSSESQPSTSPHTLCLGTFAEHSLKTAAQDPPQQASQPYSMEQGPITLPLRCIEPAPSSPNHLNHPSTQSTLRPPDRQSLVQSVPLANQALRLPHSHGSDKPSGQSSDRHTSAQLNSSGPKTSAVDPWFQMSPRPLLPTITPAVAPVTSTLAAQWEKAVRQLDLALTELIQMSPLPAPAPLSSASTYIPKPFSPSYLWTPQNLHSYACPIILSSNGRSFTNFTSPLDKRIPTNAPVITPQPHQQYPASGDSLRVSTPTLAQLPQMMRRELGVDRRLSQSSIQAPSSPAVSRSLADTQFGTPNQVASPPALSMSTSDQGSSLAQTGNDSPQSAQYTPIPSNNHLAGASVAKSAHIPHVSEVQKAKFVETYKRVNAVGKMRLEATLRKHNLWDLLSPLLSSSSNGIQNQNGGPAPALNSQPSTKSNSIPQHAASSSTSRRQLPPVSSGPATSLPNQAPVPEIQYLGHSSPRPANGSSMTPTPNVPHVNPLPTLHPAASSSSAVPTSGLDPTLAKMIMAMLCNEPQSSAVLLTALASLGIHNRIAILSHLRALAVCYTSGKDIMWKLREPSGAGAPAPKVQSTSQPSINSTLTLAPNTASLSRPTDQSNHYGAGTNSSYKAPSSTIAGASLPMNAIGNPAGIPSPQDQRVDSDHFQGIYTATEKGKQPALSITQATLPANLSDRRPSAFMVNQPAPVNDQQTMLTGQNNMKSRVLNPWNQFQKDEMHRAVVRQDERVSKNAPKEAIMGLLQEIHDKWKNMPIHEKEKFKEHAELPARVAVESFHPTPSLSHPSNNQTPGSFMAKQQAQPTSFPPLDIGRPSTVPSLGPGASNSRSTGIPQAFLYVDPQQGIAPQRYYQSSLAMSAQVSENGKEKMVAADDELQIIDLRSLDDETEKSAPAANIGLPSATQPALNKPLNGVKLLSNRPSPYLPRSKTSQSTWEANAFQDDLPGYPDVNPAFQVKGTRAKILARYPHNQQMAPIRTFAPILVKGKTK